MLTPQETASARLQGWLLADVFDTQTRKVRPQILPVIFTPPMTHANAATAFVVAKARANDAVALKALRCVMQGLKT